MEGKSKAKSGKIKTKGKSITKGGSHSPVAKTSNGKGSGHVGAAAKSSGKSKLKGTQAKKYPNELSKTFGNLALTNGKSSGDGSGNQKSTSAKSGCSKSLPTKSVNDTSGQSKAKKARTKVLVKAKVKKIKSTKFSQVKSTEPTNKKEKITNLSIVKLTRQASSRNSTTPDKSSSRSSKSPSVVFESSHNTKLSEKYKSRDSYLYKCLDAYEQSGTFEPFFLTETIVVKHNQSELDKLVYIDTVLCDRQEMQQKPQQPPKLALSKKIATGGVNQFEPIMDIGKAKEEVKQTSADRNRRNDRRVERKSLPEPENLLVPGVGILERAQRATLTRINNRVVPGKIYKLTTTKEQSVIRKRPFLPPTYIILFSEPFNQLSKITEHLGLTGIGGIIKERLEQFPRPVACVMNVTFEAPLLQVKGIESYRIPVDDDQKEDLSIYFEEVLEKMYSFESKGLATVVHCMAGVSRSASIVIAYLIRYHQKSLEEAFRQTKSAREMVNPNISFLEQLERYELANRAAELCTPWRSHTINEQTRRLPLFIITDFIDDYQHAFG